MSTMLIQGTDGFNRLLHGIEFFTRLEKEFLYKIVNGLERG